MMADQDNLESKANLDCLELMVLMDRMVEQEKLVDQELLALEATPVILGSRVEMEMTEGQDQMENLVDLDKMEIQDSQADKVAPEREVI